MQNNSADIPSKTTPPVAAAPTNGTPAVTTSEQSQLNTPASPGVPETIKTPGASGPDYERRPRPPKAKPSFVALDVHLPREAGTQAPEELPLPDHAVRMQYEIVLHGGREEFLRVKSELVMPLALEVENMAQTDVSFPEMIDQVIIRPVVTKFRSFLQKRFDAASRAANTKETAVVEPPLHNPPPSNNVKLPKPANGTSYPVPAMGAKLPSARLPGGYGNLKP